MKGTIKVIAIFSIALMLLVPMTSSCFASTPSNIAGQLEPGSDYNTVDTGGNMSKMAARIVKTIRYFAIIIGVVLIAVFGIKFMLGSAEEKAEYKKSFIPLIIGIIVVFGSTYIAEVIFNIAT